MAWFKLTVHGATKTGVRSHGVSLPPPRPAASSAGVGNMLARILAANRRHRILASAPQSDATRVLAARAAAAAGTHAGSAGSSRPVE